MGNFPDIPLKDFFGTYQFQSFVNRPKIKLKKNALSESV